MSSDSELICCRVCSGRLLKQPLLVYPNSPSSAQGFLDSCDVNDDKVDLKIYQCQQCGVVQHGHSPVPYYKDVIRAIAFSDEMGEFRKQQLDVWLRENGISEKKILEVGSGKGEYLELLQHAGARSVFGLENALESVQYAQAKGLNVVQGYLDGDIVNPWSEAFDAFAIFSFMEHWPDVNASLRNLNVLLKDGACGLVEVPNFEFVVKEGLYSEFTIDHIFYFDRSTLELVLRLNGFEVHSIDNVWHDYILSAKVTKRCALDATQFIRQQGQVIEQIIDFVDQFDQSEVVVWGAGHQALAVMSMASLNLYISHVVDSANFKQDKYTPGTHLLIKSPESLHLDRPMAVLVMAAAYSDEVASTLCHNFSHIQHVAILREKGVEIVKDGQ